MTKNKIATSLIAAFLAAAGTTVFACVDGEPGTKCGGGVPVAQEATKDATPDVKREVMENTIAESDAKETITADNKKKPNVITEDKADEKAAGKEAHIVVSPDANAEPMIDDGLKEDIKKSVEGAKDAFAPVDGTGEKPTEAETKAESTADKTGEKPAAPNVKDAANKEIKAEAAEAKAAAKADDGKKEEVKELSLFDKLKAVVSK